MSSTKEKIAIMQAYEDGKKIQGRDPETEDWFDWTGKNEPSWDWRSGDYRVKPEPCKLWVIDYPGNPNTVLCGWRTKQAAEDHLVLNLGGDFKVYQIKEFQEVLS